MRGGWRVGEAGGTDASVSEPGDDADPDEISALMGCAPGSGPVRAGPRQTGVGGTARAVAAAGHRTQVRRSGGADLRVAGGLPQDLALWHGLAGRFQVTRSSTGVRNKCTPYGGLCVRQLVGGEFLGIGPDTADAVLSGDHAR